MNRFVASFFELPRSLLSPPLHPPTAALSGSSATRKVSQEKEAVEDHTEGQEGGVPTLRLGHLIT